MRVNIVAFGKIADIAAASTWELEGIVRTDELRQQLEQSYPELQGMRYLIALNKKIVTTDTALTEGAEVALLPPYSGG